MSVLIPKYLNAFDTLKKQVIPIILSDGVVLSIEAQNENDALERLKRLAHEKYDNHKRTREFFYATDKDGNISRVNGASGAMSSPDLQIALFTPIGDLMDAAEGVGEISNGNLKAGSILLGSVLMPNAISELLGLSKFGKLAMKVDKVEKNVSNLLTKRTNELAKIYEIEDPVKREKLIRKFLKNDKFSVDIPDDYADARRVLSGDLDNASVVVGTPNDRVRMEMARVERENPDVDFDYTVTVKGSEPYAGRKEFKPMKETDGKAKYGGGIHTTDDLDNVMSYSYPITSHQNVNRVLEGSENVSNDAIKHYHELMDEYQLMLSDYNLKNTRNSVHGVNESVYGGRVSDTEVAKRIKEEAKAQGVTSGNFTYKGFTVNLDQLNGFTGAATKSAFETIPQSFFTTNPEAAKRMLDILEEMSQIQSDELQLGGMHTILGHFPRGEAKINEINRKGKSYKGGVGTDKLVKTSNDAGDDALILRNTVDPLPANNVVMFNPDMWSVVRKSGGKLISKYK